jgi:hypothetical protein
MLNHQRSTTACCRGKLPENYTTHDPVTVLLWHPGAQTEIAEACQSFYPRNRVVGLSRGFILKVGVGGFILVCVCACVCETSKKCV